MPLRARTLTTGGTVYGRAVVGVAEHTAQRSINIAALTVNEVDIDGYLKPGVPFDRSGALVGTGVAVFGVTLEPMRVANSNVAADLTAAGVVDVTLQTIGQVNRKIAEDDLGRAYTGFEVAGFDLAGSKLVLLY